MVIEISPKPKYKKVPPLLITGVIICLLAAIVVGGGYLYLYLNIKKIDESIKEKNQQAVKISQDVLKKEAEIAPIKIKIEEFSRLVSAHGSPLGIFNFLEENSLPTIWFSGFSFDSGQRLVTLSGHADEFATLEQQIAVFKEQPEVVSLTVSNVLVDEEEEIDFVFNLIFNSSILIPQLDIEE